MFIQKMRVKSLLVLKRVTETTQKDFSRADIYESVLNAGISNLEDFKNYLAKQGKVIN